MTVLDQLPQGARVAIVRLRSLGDCVLTTPAIGLLNRARPDLAIGVVVEERFRAVFEGNPAVKQILPPAWAAVRQWRPTLCVNLHGGTRSQWITALSGAPWRAGFAHHNTTLAYNIKIPRAQKILRVERTVHTAEHMASAFFALGVRLQDVPRAQLFAGDSLESAKGADARRQSAKDLARPSGGALDTAPVLSGSLVKGKYAVLHPFASAPDKQWRAERFCEVARYLSLWNIKPVFLAGPQDSVAAFREHQIAQGSLNDAKALLSKAAVFIGNDSGPAHVAAAFGTPSVVLFGSSNPAIWGPWQTEAEIVVAPEGLKQVSVSRVIAAVERLRIVEEAHA
jgi:ADP-heptose:LPS heptosyltransferase